MVLKFGRQCWDSYINCRFCLLLIITTILFISMCTFIFIAKIVEIDKYNAMGASTNAHQMF